MHCRREAHDRLSADRVEDHLPREHAGQDLHHRFRQEGRDLLPRDRDRHPVDQIFQGGRTPRQGGPNPPPRGGESAPSPNVTSCQFRPTPLPTARQPEPDAQRVGLTLSSQQKLWREHLNSGSNNRGRYTLHRVPNDVLVP